MEKIVEVDHLTKMYGKRKNTVKVLDDISFSINKGEFVGIMGPSGAGKTTLLNMIATIDSPTMGDVKVANQQIFNMTEKELSNFRKKHLGFVFQDFNLLDMLTVRENILLPMALSKEKITVMEQRLQDVVIRLGINHLLDAYPQDISIGQKQRVSVARSVITNPSLLIADEPTGSLDSKSATDLLNYLTQLNIDGERTILMVTHDAFTASYCQRILFIKDGQIFSELHRHHDRQRFFEKIIEMQTGMGGGSHYAST